MASKTVTDAVVSRIAAAWSRMPVLDANRQTKIPASGALVIEFPVAQEDQITIGAPGENIFREEGAIRLVMSIPVGQGTTLYLPWFEELRTLFRAKQFDGVTTYAPSPATTDDRSDQGSFFRLSCAIPYQFDLRA